MSCMFIYCGSLQRACRAGVGGHAALQGAEGQRPAGGTYQLRCHANQHVQEGMQESVIHLKFTGQLQWSRP